MSPSSAPMSVRGLAAAVAIGAILVTALLVSPAAVLEAVESVSADPALFGLVVLGLYLVRPALALPTTPLAAVVGYGFGVALGVPVALVGVVITVVPVFLAVRWIVGGDANGVNAATEPSVDTPSASPAGPLGCALERTGTVVARYYETAGPLRGVVASRLAPIPSDVSTSAAAVSGVRLRHLVIGTAIGELPWTVAGVVVGASAATMSTNGLGELGLTLTVACGVAAVVLLVGPAYRVVRTRTRAQNTGRSTES